MSTDLFWRPNTPIEGHRVPRAVKYILAPIYLDHDGSLGGSFVLSRQDVDFLKGILAATDKADVRDGATMLLAAIDRCGEIIVELRG